MGAAHSRRPIRKVTDSGVSAIVMAVGGDTQPSTAMYTMICVNP